MFRSISFSAIFTFLLMLTACGPSREKMISRLDEMDKALTASHPADSVKVGELISAYQGFAHKYPKDSLAPLYLFKAAGLCMSFNKSIQALDIYRAIRADYPTWRKAPDCLFLEGFIFENNIKDLAKAKQVYTEFIAQYPNSELRDDAENAIKYLGKPLDEVIREFEAKNAANDTLKTAGK
ncbi:MAG: tetratricopeptide repeat protein [Bacteroidetes bacterium]|nr:tetratricopeptide repeat protein [Bacteroidota bacterium]